MRTLTYTSMNTVFTKLRRDTGLEPGVNINEGDVIEWAGEVLEFVGAVSQYEEAVCFAIIKNSQIEMPRGLKFITQIARNVCYQEEHALCSLEDVKNVIEISDKPDMPVPLDCHGTPISEYGLAYYRPFFDLQMDYGIWTSSRTYQYCFEPVHLTEHSFFNTIVCKEQKSPYTANNSRPEYNIYGENQLRFSFKDGQVAIAYLRIKLDEQTGYPLIPDNVSYLSAIVNYIAFRKNTFDYMNGVTGSDGRMQHFEEQYHWYVGQASDNAKMLKGIDEHENFRNQRNYMLPRQNLYKNYFGNLGVPEHTSINGTRFRGNG